MTAPTAQPEPNPRSLARLRRQIRGGVLRAGDPGYDDGRAVWNGMADRHPALIARCAGSDDVARAVEFGRRHGLEIGVKGGGHGILGHAVPEGGLLIELGLLSGVSIDPKARTATVGGGALLGDLDRASLEHGLVTTAGNVSHTGVGGLTLGGGMGWLARRYGLACDNVLEYELVTADGRRTLANETTNPDLYWGLRGGGGNFGVVTRFTFRLHPLPGPALSVDLLFPAEAGPAVLEAWRAYSFEAPAASTPTAWVGRSGDWPFLPPELRGVPMVAIGFVWVGDRAEALIQVAALRRAAGEVAAAETIDEMPYADLQASGDSGMAPGMHRYWKSHYLADLSPGAIGAFVSRGLSADGTRDGEMEPNGFMQVYGGAIGQVGTYETAFSHRDAIFEFVTMAGWDDPAEDEARMDASRRFAAMMEPYASGTYVNGLADEGTAGVQRAYRQETLSRLRALKDRYDPDNVFHLNHNVAPTGG
jgi:FAD/FMN-containing dehydrogenase